MSNGFVAAPERRLEDALTYLPRKTVAEFRRGQVIYDQTRPSRGIYLVIDGRVKVATPVDNAQIVTGIFSKDDFFGDIGLIGSDAHPEMATAMERTTLMTWTTAELEEQIQKQPKLGLALIQVLVGRCLALQDRIEAFAYDKTPKRITRALIDMAERMGRRVEDGALRMPPLTHQFLSDYVGTSREIVTFQMNQLRRQGFIRYSRKAIDVHLEALREHLRETT